VTKIDLNQHLKARPSFFGTKPIETLRQVDRIERMNDVKQVNCASRLVSLKVSDEVPAHVFMANLADLAFRFLDAVFSEICRPELTDLLDNCRRMSLADRYEPNLVGMTAAPFGGGCQPRADVCKSYCQ
jgi:hypothetical protein